ncbi:MULTISPECIES: GNAT family N-acetyltransferase [Gordonia]|uniref:Acetyltransferase n=2 Tax=Gordonia alkanivorans TaxID=84096 RepID=W9DJ13_9ACTN|nr:MULTISPECIES: GNAT family N-acetyltransferase [Gordonia]ETA08602.1 acetyltransferase [Gordonia alkanivorans CGMCC 6845]MDH3005264.1 GNAT family N-acetyltransferase [Gordonia alkanivorans]MDH3010440.1 GNAT family N-acetyltransferase [Gordonia alkanivorans]MDH3014676.1 GNAT family N-acetyltransferase [Gordonia alkanivorans]MDH3019232.1 GNAT family N-acetyltransferase [Gordonia alkanivorans]
MQGARTDDMGVTVRDAVETDLAGVADIYRHYVENTVATFDYVVPSHTAWLAKYRTIREANRPFVVATLSAESDQHIVGYAYLGTFRAMPAYDRSTEDSIYVRPGLGGRGVGSALMAGLLDRADPENVRQIVAVIAATGGEGSVALHSRFGFTEVGRLRSIGHKADQWIDCVYMQKDLWEPSS